MNFLSCRQIRAYYEIVYLRWILVKGGECSFYVAEGRKVEKTQLSEPKQILYPRILQRKHWKRLYGFLIVHNKQMEQKLTLLLSFTKLDSVIN